MSKGKDTKKEEKKKPEKTIKEKRLEKKEKKLKKNSFHSQSIIVDPGDIFSLRIIVSAAE